MNRRVVVVACVWVLMGVTVIAIFGSLAWSVLVQPYQTKQLKNDATADLNFLVETHGWNVGGQGLEGLWQGQRAEIVLADWAIKYGGEQRFIYVRTHMPSLEMGLSLAPRDDPLSYPLRQELYPFPPLVGESPLTRVEVKTGDSTFDTIFHLETTRDHGSDLTALLTPEVRKALSHCHQTAQRHDFTLVLGDTFIHAERREYSASPEVVRDILDAQAALRAAVERARMNP